ncbi:MAG: M48 family metalloprotease, partial [Acidobacteria bacterium]|nr:M48 family metalloprotease [Acidobacteriota bacterium]
MAAPGRGGAISVFRLPARVLIAAAFGLVCAPLLFGQQAGEEATGSERRDLLVTGHEVFQALVKSPAVAEAGAALDWRFLLLNDQSVNAHSDSKGTVWVGGGLAEMLGPDRGLWAAALSHEIAHCLLRHPGRGLATLHRAFPYVFGKALRDREHRADLAGMMLMARAGYHPDSLFALHHRLRAAHGERPGAVAFFGSHPRWQTREQRLEQALPEALAAFVQAWPDAAASPGGVPPLVVFLDKPRVVAAGASSRISVELACRNSSQPLTVLLLFESPGATAGATSGAMGQLRRQVECAPGMA